MPYSAYNWGLLATLQAEGLAWEVDPTGDRSTPNGHLVIDDEYKVVVQSTATSPMVVVVEWLGIPIDLTGDGYSLCETNTDVLAAKIYTPRSFPVSTEEFVELLWELLESRDDDFSDE